MVSYKCFVSHLAQACIFLFVLALSVCADEWLWVRPLPATEAKVQQEYMTSADKPDEPFVTRRGYVGFSTNFVKRSRSVQVSESLQMMLFDATPEKAATTVKARVGQRVSVPDGVVSISARLEGSEVNTVLITSSEDRVLITIQDKRTDRQYRVTGDLQTGVGEVIEIDPAKMPPVLCETCCSLSDAFVKPAESEEPKP